MSDEIDLTLKWDKKTYLEGAKIAYDAMMRFSPKRYLGWFFIALTQFGVIGALKANVYGLLLLSTILVVYWYWLRWPLRKIALGRYFEKSPFANKTLRITADKNGICIDGSCVPWREFQRVLATKKGYLLDMTDSFLFIPRSLFRNEDEMKFFSTLLIDNIKNFEKIEN